MNKVIFHNKGLIDYKVGWDFQEKLFKFITDRKMLNRNLELAQQVSTQSHLIFCEHPHVFTLGKSGDEENLLANEEQIAAMKANYLGGNYGYGHAKQALFELIVEKFKTEREN